MVTIIQNNFSYMIYKLLLPLFRNYIISQLSKNGLGNHLIDTILEKLGLKGLSLSPLKSDSKTAPDLDSEIIRSRMNFVQNLEKSLDPKIFWAVIMETEPTEAELEELKKDSYEARHAFCHSYEYGIKIQKLMAKLTAIYQNQNHES